MALAFNKDLQYYKFCLYGFLKNLRFFEPFLYLFFLEKGMTFLQIGTLITVREITRNLFEIPAGMMADALGRRRTMISSFIFYILSFLIFFFSSGYILFILAMVVYSFGEAFRTGTHKAMIFEYLKIKGWEDQKIHYYGHTRSASQVGSAVSSLLAAVIVFTTGEYRIIFLFSGIPYLLDLALMFTYPKELDGIAGRIEMKTLGNNFRAVFKEVIISLKQPALIRAINNLSVYSGYFRATKDYLQPVIQTIAVGMAVHFGMQGEKTTAIFIGIIYFLIYLSTSFMARGSGKFADRFGNPGLPLNISLIAGLFFGLVSGILFITSSTLFGILTVIAFAGIYLVENLRKPIGVGYITGLLKKDILATSLSTESQIKSIYAAILAPVMGFLADMVGVGAAMIIVSLLVLLFFPLLAVVKK